MSGSFDLPERFFEHLSREQAADDDEWFERVGDLLTPGELRALDLRKPDNLLLSIEYLGDPGNQVPDEGAQ